MSYVAVAGIGVSLVTSFIGGSRAKKEAKRQRELQKSMFLANLTSQEKLKYEELKLLGETERTKILANSLLGYKVALQKESTQRLKDTWIYVAGSGLGISLIYGVALIGGSYKKQK
jgi:F0F1-type ATP synthase membrane subunit c/vacuolar-type H+-ATPase subunit K